MADDPTDAADRSPDTALHPAGAMAFGGSRLRQDCWDAIDAAVLDRLNRLAGKVRYWWACPEHLHARDLPKAALLGDRGLFFAEPRPKRTKPQFYSVSGYEFVQGSVTVDKIEDSMAVGDRTSLAEERSGTSDLPADLGLLPTVKGVLGNLPLRAQQLLQAPFATGVPVRRQEYYYEGSRHHLSVFALFLAGDEDLVVATGSKVALDGGDGVAVEHWLLKVHRALVTVCDPQVVRPPDSDDQTR